MSNMESLMQNVHEKNLSPLWEFEYEMFTTEPKSPIGPWLWKGKEIISLLTQFANSFPRVGGDRRALSLIHPDAKQYKGANWNFQIGFQLIKKGEKAPPHRHSPQAARFVIDGTAATILNGDRYDMEAGDFVLTPQWVYHEHIKDDDGMAVWLDMLDIPFVARQGLFFFQQMEWQEPTKSENQLIRRATQKSLVPSTNAGSKPESPWIYKWTDMKETLDEMRELQLKDDYNGVKVTYHNPLSKEVGVSPTFGADVNLLEPGLETKLHRHTSAPIYYVIQGRGSTTIDGKKFDWEKHDVLAVPSWSWHSHKNVGKEPAILLEIHDEPLLRSLGLYREETDQKRK